MLSLQHRTNQSLFGNYGGAFVPESLNWALRELEEAYVFYFNSRELTEEIRKELLHYSGRPTPIYFAERWSKMLGGAKMFFKREDLNSTGSHKINNVIGQMLLAKRMNKTRVVAETGAGQHGVAVSTFAAKLNLECTVYMGEEDAKRQSANVKRMELLGAWVKRVSSGSRGLKEALSEAIRDWVANSESTFYILGTASGPYPYPTIVRNFQRLIGEESFLQMNSLGVENPDVVVASIGGGSNSIGMFFPFIKLGTELIGVEAAGKGQKLKDHAASLNLGEPGILHGVYSYLVQTTDGQIGKTQSISAGLDYPGVGPEHSWLKDTGRICYSAVSDGGALVAFAQCIRIEGIVPALESCHALSYATSRAQNSETNKSILICLSGSGEKDIRNLEQRVDGEQFQ